MVYCIVKVVFVFDSWVFLGGCVDLEDYFDDFEVFCEGFSDEKVLEIFDVECGGFVWWIVVCWEMFEEVGFFFVVGGFVLLQIVSEVCECVFEDELVFFDVLFECNICFDVMVIEEIVCFIMLFGFFWCFDVCFFVVYVFVGQEFVYDEGEIVNWSWV